MIAITISSKYEDTRCWGMTHLSYVIVSQGAMSWWSNMLTDQDSRWSQILRKHKKVCVIIIIT